MSTFYVVDGDNVERMLATDLTQTLIEEGFIVYCRRSGMTDKEAGAESGELDVDYTIFLFESELEQNEVSFLDNNNTTVWTINFWDILEEMEKLNR